jgi:hypothetical protein|tara:strand:- start:345 stop:833 length:489 start_codon:yes stop_codon:yes gene_type:complete
MTIIVKPFKRHKELKKTLLSLIDELPKNSEKTIHNTDWNLSKEYEKKYLNLFYLNINEHMMSLCKEFNCDKWFIDNGWFQQYKNCDEHGWHNHPKCQFSNVYYLELPDKNMTTEFYDGQEIEASEGDILTFPSYLIHRSKPNLTNKRKTIIAFNSSLMHGHN